MQRQDLKVETGRLAVVWGFFKAKCLNHFAGRLFLKWKKEKEWERKMDQSHVLYNVLKGIHPVNKRICTRNESYRNVLHIHRPVCSREEPRQAHEVRWRTFAASVWIFRAAVKSLSYIMLDFLDYALEPVFIFVTCISYFCNQFFYV